MQRALAQRLRHPEQVTATLSPLHWKETHPRCFGNLVPETGEFLRSEVEGPAFTLRHRSMRELKADSSFLLRNCWFRDKGVPKQRGWFLSNVTAATPRSLAPKKLPSFGNKIPETPGVGFLQMFRDFGLARLVGPDHPKSRNIGGVGFFPM